MKRKLTTIICVILAFILLFPVRLQYKDGGTVEYKALLYSIYDVHRINPDMESEEMFIEGLIIEILGVKIFDNTGK
ncbi:MAG: hypothetical protein IKM61_06300 [Eubacteriaceae bacterium]|nr:hypothetical protein [Eubacteriaceae bacterium]